MCVLLTILMVVQKLKSFFFTYLKKVFNALKNTKFQKTTVAICVFSNHCNFVLKRSLKAFLKRLLTHPNRRIAGKQTLLTAFSNELGIGNVDETLVEIGNIGPR